MRFGDNLRNLRIARGLTQMQLAEGIQTSQAAITAWELSKREPDFKTIRKIADYFNVPLSALLPSNDDMTDDYIHSVADSLHQNPKFGLLFDKIRYLSESDLDAVLSVVNAISKERDPNE